MLRPHLIISFGSYVSTPVVFSGWLLGIKSIAHESSIIPGLATKINSLFVDRIFTSWEKTQQYFEKSKCQYIGNLVRQSIFNSKVKTPKINSFFKKAGTSPLLYITGGNQGSHTINKVIFKIYNRFPKNFYILHQIGTANYPKDFESAQKIKNLNYQAVVSLDPDEVGAILKRSTIVISRSGANTVWELSLLGKPAILIPLSISSGGEQEQNAKILEKGGTAKVINQKDLTTQYLIEIIEDLEKNLPKYQSAAEKFSKTLPTDAASQLSRYITKILSS